MLPLCHFVLLTFCTVALIIILNSIYSPPHHFCELISKKNQQYGSTPPLKNMAFLGMASPLRLHSGELLFFFDISLKETRQCDDFLYTEFFIILPTNYPTFTILSQVPYLSKPNIFCWSVSAIVTRGEAFIISAWSNKPSVSQFCTWDHFTSISCRS